MKNLLTGANIQQQIFLRFYLNFGLYSCQLHFYHPLMCATLLGMDLELNVKLELLQIKEKFLSVLHLLKIIEFHTSS